MNARPLGECTFATKGCSDPLTFGLIWEELGRVKNEGTMPRYDAMARERRMFFSPRFSRALKGNQIRFRERYRRPEKCRLSGNPPRSGHTLPGRNIEPAFNEPDSLPMTINFPSPIFNCYSCPPIVFLFPTETGTCYTVSRSHPSHKLSIFIPIERFPVILSGFLSGRKESSSPFQQTIGHSLAFSRRPEAKRIDERWLLTNIIMRKVPPFLSSFYLYRQIFLSLPPFLRGDHCPL